MNRIPPARIHLDSDPRWEGRPILQRGDRRLRQTSRPIVLEDSTPKDPDPLSLQTLIDHLLARVAASQGVGIAAPQIGVAERLFIVASHPNARYPNAPHMAPTAMINPVLSDRSDREELGWEGCLSVPNCRAQVSRAAEIRVEYFDRRGTLQRSQLSGFIARIFQHELDHLDGILFVDRVKPEHCISEAEYQQRLEA